MPDPTPIDAYEPALPLDTDLEGPEPEWMSEPAPPPDAKRADGLVRRLLRLRADETVVRITATERRQDIDEWQDRQVRRLQAQQRWIESALERYHRAALERDPKALTLHLPAGDLVARKGQPEWVIEHDETEDETDGPFWAWVLPEDAQRRIEQAAELFYATAQLVLSEASPLPEAVRVKPPKAPELDKPGMKDALTRRNDKGKAIGWGITAAGEQPPGLTVKEAERTFTVKATQTDLEWLDEDIRGETA